ncbi:response regulator [Desulfosarcina sp.]|uniref:hybrid sensor histidine kinase/response regulator n=1 Tax=Desulfosarcina sp. TaxID=2027861 RepID=UPI003566F26E
MTQPTEQPSGHVLIVDDDEIMRDAADGSLKAAGFKVSQAENGLRAMEALDDLRPDVILLDVMMPEMNGFDTAQAVRQKAGFASVPILIMTALDDLESINRAFEVGATDFITKPINWVILVERVRFMMRAVRMMDAQRQLQNELVQAQKMEALGTLAGGVAHDLNNVLSAIISYPELLLCKLDSDSPLRKPILTIQQAGQRAAEIVNDLLTLARRGVSVKKVIDINKIVLDYLNSPEHEKLVSHHPHISIETNLSPDLLNVTGSPIHIRKTIMNLVSNAAEAQPDGGRISISTYNHTFSPPEMGVETVREGEFVAFEISDKGCGISKSDLNRIYEPFFTKKVMGRSGTGLGMAVVWGTVQDHHGYIDVTSQPDEGTTFCITLPATREIAQKAQASVPADEYRGDGQVILVVDDVEEQREIATDILEMLNYKPISVESGEKAIAFLKTGSADLVLLDMIMDPGLDGLETFTKIIGFKPNQKTIIASGYAKTVRVDKVIRLGASQFIKKPYTMETVGLAIKNELQK